VDKVADNVTVRRPPLRYHGGKWKLAPWIIGHFPRHRIYVEPFGGGASVLMRKPRSYAEVYNDAWGDVVNVFRVLRDRPAELERLLHLTPFSREDFDLCSERADNPVEQARRTIYRSLAGFGSAAVNGKHTTGFRANSKRAGTTPAQDWMNYPTHVQAFAERLRGVVIENRDAWDVMRQHDSPETLHYVDPPYMHETRNLRRGNAIYHREMTDQDHEVLLERLRSLTGMVVLSGYRTELYDAGLPGWTRVDRLAKADGARDRIESLWLNPAAADGTQQRLFG
jgi:DNA adenine methylase